MRAEGYNGAMELRGDAVVITRKLFFGKSKGEKSIALKSITAVQLKKAGLAAGFLQLAYSGSKESKGGLFDAAKDENTVMFYKSSQADFEALQQEIEQRRVGHPTAVVGSMSEEITRLAQLHADGHLTDEEYSQSKRKLLGI
jgi:hypothetical protein